MHYTEMSLQLDYVSCYLYNRYPMAETHILHVERRREKGGGRERKRDCTGNILPFICCVYSFHVFDTLYRVLTLKSQLNTGMMAICLCRIVVRSILGENCVHVQKK